MYGSTKRKNEESWQEQEWGTVNNEEHPVLPQKPSFFKDHIQKSTTDNAKSR